MKYAVITGLMPIQRALEWAFRDECARLAFDEIAESSGAVQVGVDTVWQLMQQGRLGCQIDGGGHSQAASDAQIIASIIGQMPPEHGGRQMAITVPRRTPCMVIGTAIWLGLRVSA